MGNRLNNIKNNSRLSKGKKILIIVMAGILLIGVGGYFGYTKYMEHGYAVMLESALKAKYGTTFNAKDLKASKEDGIIAYLRVGGEEDFLIKAACEFTGGNLRDDYVASKLSREITKEVEENLKGEENLYIHTDNRLEYTDAGKADFHSISTADYLKEHPEDAFDVTILINKEKSDPEALRNLLGSRAYALTVERGNYTVYALSEDVFETAIKDIRHYDSMKTDAAVKDIEKAGEPVLVLAFEEINPPMENKTNVEIETKKETDTDAKDTDNQ